MHGLLWRNAYCVDDRTMAINISGCTYCNRVKAIPMYHQDYLAVQCVGHVQINVTYDGIMPTTGNILSSHYMAEKMLHVTTLHIPYRSDKSGNYSFQLFNQTRTEWFYFIFQTNSVEFWRPDKEQLGLVEETYEDPFDKQNVIIPCQLNSPKTKAALWHPSFQTENFEGIKQLLQTSIFIWDDTQYDYKVTYGVVIRKDKLLNYLDLTKSFGDSDIIHCVDINPPHSVATVRVKLHSTLVDKEPNNNTGLTMSVHNRKFYCQATTPVYFINIYFISSCERIFVSKCALKNTTCPWNSYFSDTGEYIPSRSMLHNKNVQNYNGLSPEPTRGFRSGIAICGTQTRDSGCGAPVCGLMSFLYSFAGTKEEHSLIEEMYFTGLDNEIYYLREWREIASKNLVSVSSATPNISKVYADTNETLSCKSIYFVFLPSFEWTVVFANNTILPLIQNRPKKDKEFLSLVQSRDHQIGVAEDISIGYIPPDVKEIVCRCLVRNTDDEFVEARLPIYTKSAPVVIDKVNKLILKNLKESFVLSCRARGDQAPSITWLFNGQEIDNANHVARMYPAQNQTVLSELRISNFTNLSKNDNFTCRALNSEGEDYGIFLFDAPENETISLGIILGVSLGFGAAVTILLTTVMIVTRKRKLTLTKEEIYKFLYGMPKKTNLSSYFNHACIPYKMEYEVDVNEFSIDADCILGSGAYGVVFMGQVRGVGAAVKTLQPGTLKDIVLALLDEIKIMSFLNEHPNIVGFIGANTGNISRGEVYLFVEFCEMGSVEKYLRKKKSALLNLDLSVRMGERCALQRKLANWSMQTACGMKYLADSKIIHGDLAVRNLLLKDSSTIKITDFGLAIKLQNYTVYAKSQKGLLPWRHMSPECLSAKKFSVKSDVWAFGVTLWEMFSLAEIPYSGLQWTVGFTSVLEGGLRLEEPSFCLEEMFPLMKQCWELNPQRRPNFDELIASLNIILLTIHGSEYLQVSYD